MKKRNLLLILLFLVAAIFTLAACKEGEQGAKGEQGDRGAAGDKGPAGDKGAKGDSGDQGDTGAKGADAKEPEFEVTDEGVMWRLKGEENWKVLVSAEDLIGYSKKYTISFDANGGSAVKELTKQIFKTEVELPVSKLAGYTFAYWADAEGNEIEDNKLTVLEDTELKAVWGSSVELSKTALGEAFDVSGLTEGIAFNVTKFNSGASDGYTIDLGTQAKAGDAAGTYWYRIFLKAVDAENGVYEVVGRLTSGEANSLADYPYDIMIGTHSACQDAEGYAALKGLVEAEESPVGYIVKVTGLDLNAAAGALAAPWAVKVYSGYEKNVDLVIKGSKKDLGTATATGKTFIGWSADGLTFVNGEVTPTGDITYRPVFNYTVTFDSKGGSAVAAKTVAAAADYAAALPEPTNDPKVFAGWYADEALTKKVEKLPLTTCTLYAKWNSITTVNFDLDGGKLDGYADFAAIQADLLADYNKYRGSSLDAAGVQALSIWNTDVATFLSENDNAMALKWSWLIDWAAENELNENKASAAGYKSNNYTIKTAGHDNYGITYIFRAIMGGNSVREGHADWGTLDYSQAAQQNGIVAAAAAKGLILTNPALFAEAVDTLPTASKEGATFAGWMDDQGNMVTSIPLADAPKTITLKAKWVEQITKDMIISKFLADINTAAQAATLTEADITADQFYDTFKTNCTTLLKTDTMKDYQWLIEWIAAKNNTNKRIKGAMNELGYTLEYSGSDPVFDNYSEQFLANDIMNFLTGTGETVHGGSHSSYPAVDFTAANAYDGLITAAIAAEFDAE